MTAPVDSAHATELPAAWARFVIRASAWEDLDDIVVCSLPEVVDALEPSLWSFTRVIDEDGPGIRLVLGADAWGDEELDRAEAVLSRDVPETDRPPGPPPVLALPVSGRATEATGAVARTDDDAHDPQEGLDQVGSQTAIDVLPHLDSPDTRLAYGLTIVAAFSETVLPRASAARFWDAAAEELAGPTPAGAKVLSELRERASKDPEALAVPARELRDRKRTGAAIGKLAAAAEAITQSEGTRLRRQVHLTLNRAGLTSLEEMLLLSTMAAGLREAAA